MRIRTHRGFGVSAATLVVVCLWPGLALANHDGMAEGIFAMLALIGIGSLAALGVLIASVISIRQARAGDAAARQRCRRLAIIDFILAVAAVVLLVLFAAADTVVVLLFAAMLFAGLGQASRRAGALPVA